MTKGDSQDLLIFTFYCILKSAMFVYSYHQILDFQRWNISRYLMKYLSGRERRVGFRDGNLLKMKFSSRNNF